MANGKPQPAALRVNRQRREQSDNRIEGSLNRSGKLGLSPNELLEVLEEEQAIVREDLSRGGGIESRSSGH